MANERKETFLPDYAIPPGETLLETLEAMGMSQKELAIRIGLSEKHIVDIVKGVGPITPDTALKLERALGIPASFWNNLERNYRDTLARLEEEKRLRQDVKWLEEIPVAALVRRGYIQGHKDKTKTLQEVLGFYGASSPRQWSELWQNNRFHARRSRAFDEKPGAVSAWMRIGELAAQRIECAVYDRARFKQALKEIRGLTVENAEAFQPNVRQLCADAGVAVVFVKEIPGIRLSGVTRWLTPDKALIQLSLRYKKDDQLWFTFFHEAGHILEHGKKEMFLEEDDGIVEEKEKQADKFAADFLISRAAWRRFTSGRRYYSKIDIRRFAEKMGISPGIVVGRLQHENLIPFSNCNDLKKTLVWISDT